MRAFVTSLAFGSLFAGTAALADHHENDAAIAAAMSAAPAAISANATITTWDGTVLREGSNGWTCIPGFAEGDENPACNDAAWTHWVLTNGGGKGTEAEANATGVSYMLASDPPHMMIIVPEEGGYEGLNTEPGDGEAWIMWGDKPGRHIMIPIGVNDGDDTE